MPVPVVPWPHGTAPTEAAIARLLRAEGLQPSTWSNGPGDRYAVHQHAYSKVLYCLQGGIRFTLPREGTEAGVDLGPDDRFELPAETPHGAVVGPHGCRCIEAARWER